MASHQGGSVYCGTNCIPQKELDDAQLGSDESVHSSTSDYKEDGEEGREGEGVCDFVEDGAGVYGDNELAATDPCTEDGDCAPTSYPDPYAEDGACASDVTYTFCVVSSPVDKEDSSLEYHSAMVHGMKTVIRHNQHQCFTRGPSARKSPKVHEKILTQSPEQGKIDGNLMYTLDPPYQPFLGLAEDIPVELCGYMDPMERMMFYVPAKEREKAWNLEVCTHLLLDD